MPLALSADWQEQGARSEGNKKAARRLLFGVVVFVIKVWCLIGKIKQLCCC